MKKSLLILLFALGVSYWGWGQLITFDNFNYPDGSLLTANGWVAHSGAGSNAIDVGASNGLTYAGYSGLTGITGVVEGNSARLDNTGEDDSKTFTPVTSGIIYSAFLVNVTTGTSGYFLHLGSSATNFAARLWVKPSVTPLKINFGISNSSTASYATIPSDFDPGVTYLIIIKYDVSTTGTVSLWVKSTGIPTTEAGAGAPEVSATGSGLANIDRICLRQYSATQNITIDGIRVGPTWADVLPSSVVGTPTKLVVTSVNGGSSPVSGIPFAISIQAQDDAGLPQPVTSDVNITLSGSGIGGNITGTILNGQNSVSISGVTMSEGYGLTITATQTSGTPALTSGTSAPFNVTSATPNYRSKTSGNWNAAGTWEIQISGNWYDAPDFPNSPNKVVTVLNGHTIAVTDNNGKCGNLTIDTGGKLWKNSPSSASYLYVYGNILNNGTIGSSDGGVTPSALGFDIEGTSCLISGTGTFDAWRMAKFTNANVTTNIIIDQDITLRNTVASSVYNSVASTTLNILINSGKKLAVTSAGIDLLNINLTISSGASLLDNGTITNQTGTNVTVERNYSGNEWHLISSPVSDATANMFLGLYLQTHTESTNAYTDISNPATPLNVMQGYALWNDLAGTASFVGTLNTGAIGSLNNLTRSGAGLNYGWNLVGNPYPSPIDWDAATGWTKTNVDNATYRHVNNATWATYVGGVGANGGTRYITSCQGFFVGVTDGQTVGTMNMDNNVRTHNAAPFFKDEVADIVRLEVSGNGYTDEAVIRFLDVATQEFDGQWDAHKLFGSVPEAPAIYSMDNGMMAINSLPSTNTCSCRSESRCSW